MMIESDFYATDAGRQHFADQLKSIRYCVQETCNFDALYAYLTCGNYDFNYDRAKNLRPKRNIRTAMNNEIMMYAIAQKEQMGFDKAVEECSEWLLPACTSPRVCSSARRALRRVPHVALRRHAQHDVRSCCRSLAPSSCG